MKRLRIGRRRGKGDGLALSPLELALYPALDEGRWHVPDRFNFTRDVVEALADDPKRRAVTFIGRDGIIEPRTFHVLSEHAARWSSLLRERGVRPGDPVLVLAGTNVDWIEVVLACIKVGAVVVPCPPTLSAETIDVRLERTGADLVVAERVAEPEIERTTNRPMVLYVDDGRLLLEDASPDAPTHDTSSRDLAFVTETPGTSGNTKLVGHSHGSVFAARVAAEHWLDAGRGDAVWCPARPGSTESIWHALVGPWSRGAELLVHDGAFDALERLDLIYRLGVTVLCQTPAEYAALSELRELARFHPPQLRRLVSTGDWLDPSVAAVFEETWGLTVHDGYGQAETNVVVANSAEAGFKQGSLGRALPGHQVAVIDDQGNELPPNAEGELAVRGRPPTLFAGYWESPEQTKQAFRGDWYATGDLAVVDEDDFFWFVGRGSDVITSRGERFGPYEAERALRAHTAVTASSVVGVRDLERGGQFVRAFVVLAEGVAESEQLEAELRHEVALTLPEHEVPREIEFVDELPTVPGGKIRRLELRERLVVGRPLWDLPAADEPEHDPWGGMLDPWPSQQPESAPEPPREPPSDDALPDYIVEPEPVVEAAPAEPVAEALPDYIVDQPPSAPAPEPEADVAPATEPEPRGEAAQSEEPEPIVQILPGPEPQPAPPRPLIEPEPIPEPPAPDLVPEPEPDPEPEPEPEPEALVEPAPSVAIEPEPEHGLEPEPGPDLASQPDPDPVPTGVWVPVVTEPAPEPDPKPEPELGPEPAPDPSPELPPAAEATELPEWVVETEPEPEAFVDPVPERAADPTPAPALEPEAEVAPAAEPELRGEAAHKTADSILNPEPPPGPLPDFIVDPEQQSSEGEAAADLMPKLRLSEPKTPDVEPAADEPSIQSLGLPPLTEFPSLPTIERGEATAADDEAADDDEEPEQRQARRGRRNAPEPPKRGRRLRSSGEPGDMSETVDWAGLSSRLSAYSLSGEDASAESPDSGASDEPGEAEPDVDGRSDAGTEDDTDA